MKRDGKKVVLALKLIRNVCVCSTDSVCMNEFMCGIDKMLNMQHTRAGENNSRWKHISMVMYRVCVCVFSPYFTIVTSSLCDEKLFENWELKPSKTEEQNKNYIICI